jgi:hypothetical protein
LKQFRLPLFSNICLRAKLNIEIQASKMVFDLEKLLHF